MNVLGRLTLQEDGQHGNAGITALHIPTDYGRKPTCCIDDRLELGRKAQHVGVPSECVTYADSRGHWIIEDYLHFIFTTCTMLFAGLLDYKQSRLLGYL
ncbi:hypothetical protein, partial [Bosea sp. (in: a-proteobacteria)]|uniref:hypothetical protein n=1 Tax=Bosea sp. (in: a-proteobacteria) TaxID=1871050 RepID=UPI0040341B93